MVGRMKLVARGLAVVFWALHFVLFADVAGGAESELGRAAALTAAFIASGLSWHNASQLLAAMCSRQVSANHPAANTALDFDRSKH